VATSPGKLLRSSPLMVYGGVVLGKNTTCGRRIVQDQNGPDEICNLLYVSAREFVINSMIPIKDGNVKSFNQFLHAGGCVDHRWYSVFPSRKDKNSRDVFSHIHHLHQSKKQIINDFWLSPADFWKFGGATAMFMGFDGRSSMPEFWDPSVELFGTKNGVRRISIPDRCW